MATKPDETELVVLPAAHVAKRSEPVSAIGRRPGEPRFYLKQAKWSFWKKYGRLPLIDAILLSVDLDPETEPGNTAEGLTRLRLFLDVLKMIDAESWSRLRERARIVMSSVDDLRFADGKKGDSRSSLESIVRLPDVRELTDAKNLQVPAEFPRADGGSAMIATGRWPWGDYENALLRHLADAIQFFWAQEEDRQDAALKEEVVKWLRQRGVSKGKADAIALIIRPDDIAPGPRRKEEE